MIVADTRIAIQLTSGMEALCGILFFGIFFLGYSFLEFSFRLLLLRLLSSLFFSSDPLAVDCWLLFNKTKFLNF